MLGRGRSAAPTAWIVTWVAYASYYAGRKGFSVSKKAIRSELGFSESALGAIDTAYLGAYAAGQFVSGWFGDRVGARRLIAFGMLASAAACGLFASAQTSLAFGAIFLINGFAQSTGWPGTTRAMAEWTTQNNRGTVMAFWATCYQVGGLAATWFCGYLLGQYGWRSTFLGPALWMALVGLVVYGVLRPGPGSPPVVVAVSAGSAGRSGSDVLAARRAAQLAVLRSRTLWSYGSSYFFIKFIRYAILFWMPYYLSHVLGYAGDQAAYVSTAFEVGGIAGVIAIGTLSDRVRRFSRPLLSAISLVGLGGALLLYSRVEHLGWWANVLALALIGAFLFAPDSLLSGAASQDAGGPHAAATATGFVNGVGSIGGMLEGLLVPQLSRTWGWGVVFPCLAGLAVLAALSLAPTLRRPPPAPATQR